ncbi:hypothetical protein [Desulfurobacterium atlanticum]|uniref:Uncharacterized protein n=1 Tax=Desulfurobacterium atlanticum TaxID=240169 RepID=A0A238YFW1_9BACT|nr:hypothetical protein [Desulfurobacterium atlanticum]SNR69960.1 hypothetical protein SAMN06265340_103115 [Desulfurobacterium atlanticum]
MKFKKLLKCSTCGNVGEFEYIGSRNLNKNGEIKEIAGKNGLWISYFKCPECNTIDVEMYPVGTKPDIPEDFFKEVLVDEKKNSHNTKENS